MEKQDENERCVLSPENRETLKTINEDPASAIEYDLSHFLSELTGRIESGELGLKDQMCDKALKQIQVVNDKKIISALVEQRKSYLAEREKLIEELNSLSIYQEREKIEREIEAHQNHASSANSDIDSERKHLNSLEEEIERARSVLLADIKHVFGSDSEINYDSLPESL
jgi:chromosome segregation ATPase